MGNKSSCNAPKPQRDKTQPLNKNQGRSLTPDTTLQKINSIRGPRIYEDLDSSKRAQSEEGVRGGKSFQFSDSSFRREPYSTADIRKKEISKNLEFVSEAVGLMANFQNNLILSDLGNILFKTDLEKSSNPSYINYLKENHTRSNILRSNIFNEKFNAPLDVERFQDLPVSKFSLTEPEYQSLLKKEVEKKAVHSAQQENILLVKKRRGLDVENESVLQVDKGSVRIENESVLPNEKGSVLIVKNDTLLPVKNESVLPIEKERILQAEKARILPVEKENWLNTELANTDKDQSSKTGESMVNPIQENLLSKLSNTSNSTENLASSYQWKEKLNQQIGETRTILKKLGVSIKEGEGLSQDVSGLDVDADFEKILKEQRMKIMREVPSENSSVKAGGENPKSTLKKASPIDKADAKNTSLRGKLNEEKTNMEYFLPFEPQESSKAKKKHFIEKSAYEHLSKGKTENSEEIPLTSFSLIEMKKKKAGSKLHQPSTPNSGRTRDLLLKQKTPKDKSKFIIDPNSSEGLSSIHEYGHLSKIKPEQKPNPNQREIEDHIWEGRFGQDSSKFAAPSKSNIKENLNLFLKENSGLASKSMNSAQKHKPKGSQLNKTVEAQPLMGSSYKPYEAEKKKKNAASIKKPASSSSKNTQYLSSYNERSGVSTTKSILKSRSKSPLNPSYKEDRITGKYHPEGNDSSSDTICLADLTDQQNENFNRSKIENKSVSPVRVHLVLEEMDVGEMSKNKKANDLGGRKVFCPGLISSQFVELSPIPSKGGHMINLSNRESKSPLNLTNSIARSSGNREQSDKISIRNLLLNSTSQEDFQQRNFRKPHQYLNQTPEIEEENYGTTQNSKGPHSKGKKGKAGEKIDFDRDRFFQEKKGIDIKSDLSPWRKEFYPVYKEFDS